MLEEQPKEPEPTLVEVLGSLQKNEIFKEQLASWSPRTIKIGADVPANGNVEQYQPASPERILIEYLGFWKTKNYGKMSQLLSHLVKGIGNKTVLEVRQMFEGREIDVFEIITIEDEAPAITNIHVRIKEQLYDETKDHVVIARMINEDKEGNPIVHGSPGGEWHIIWYGLNHEEANEV